MKDLDKILPVTQVKRHFLDILKSIEEDDSTFAVTRNGRAVGIIMTPGRYESLLETIEILSDKEIVKSLASSAKDFKSGRVYSHDEVWE
jgi:PHD/YefM family antitoxin component YafN of YafNO toxin-antitoxin module/mRNA-degrading endonuclease RelE of RelBE toxin-antitoxin system